jgi:lysophospholipase L1-like esterase
MASDIKRYQVGSSQTAVADPAFSPLPANNVTGTNMLKIRAKLAAAEAGTGICKICIIGDSYSSGPTGVAAGESDSGSTLARMFANQGFRVGEIVHVWNNAVADRRVTTSGTWITGDRPGGMPYLSATVAANTLTFVSTYPGTSAVITTRGTTAAFTVAIDGVSQGAITPSAVNGPQVLTYPGLDDTIHTITITTVTGTNYVGAIGVLPPHGVVIENAGIAGSATADWRVNPSTYGHLPSALATGADIALIELSATDAEAAVATSTVLTNLTAISTAVKAAAAAPVLIVSHSQPTTTVPTATYDGYVAAVEAAAVATAAPSLNMNDVFGLYTDHFAAGLTVDSGAHLSASGASVKARIVLDFLAPAPALNARLAASHARSQSGPSPTVRDGFTGVDGATLDSAWTTQVGTVDINGNRARFVTASTAYGAARIVRAGVADGEELVKFQWGVAGAERYAALYCRYLDNSNYYSLYAERGRVVMDRRVGGSTTNLATMAGSFNVGQYCWARYRWQGTSFKGRVWADWSPEPTAWSTQGTDASLSLPGLVAVEFTTGNTGSGAMTGYVDDYRLWDLTAAPGLPVPSSGQYFYPVSPNNQTTGNSLGNASLRVAPWLLTKPLALSRLCAEVTTAGDVGSKFRLGIYADNGNGLPGSLVLDGGQVAGDSATVQELTVSVTLAPGLYWIGGALQSVTTTQPVIRVANNWSPPIPMSAGTSLPASAQSVLGYISSSTVSGALPGSFGGATPSGTIPRVFVKVA